MSRNRLADSSRWREFEYRQGDIVIASYGKTGTTWVQQLVGQLVFKGAENVRTGTISPWLEYLGRDKEEVFATLRDQTHRRFLKTHLPSHSLPLYEEAYYIYVARDPRDQIWSAYDHFSCLDPTALLRSSLESSEPDPSSDLVSHRDFYHHRLDQSEDNPWPYWAHVLSWWRLRNLPNVLLVHYSSLKADFSGESRRIADFLRIELEDEIWNHVIDHCHFEYMKSNATTIAGPEAYALSGGPGVLMNRGVNGRWRQVLTSQEVDKCDEIAARYLPPECVDWLTSGE